MTWFLDKEFLEKLDLRAYAPAVIATRLGLERDVVAAFVDPMRRYMVQSSDYGWLAGANGDDLPTLVFVGAPRLSGGQQPLLNAVSFDLRTGAVTTRPVPIDDDLADIEEAVLDTLEEEIGFEHVGNAPVLAFKHPELWHYAVVPFPWDLHKEALGLSDEADLDAVREWIEEGSFVLHCGNAYYMDAEGEVTSS
jgi:hypothetical protein